MINYYHSLFKRSSFATNCFKKSRTFLNLDFFLNFLYFRSDPKFKDFNVKTPERANFTNVSEWILNISRELFFFLLHSFLSFRVLSVKAISSGRRVLFPSEVVFRFVFFYILFYSFFDFFRLIDDLCIGDSNFPRIDVMTAEHIMHVANGTVTNISAVQWNKEILEKIMANYF